MKSQAPGLAGLTPHWEATGGQRLIRPGGCVAHILIFRRDSTHCPGSSVAWTQPRKPSSPPPPSPARARKFYPGDPPYRALNGFPKITIFLLCFPFSQKGEGRKQQPGVKPASTCRQSKENMRMLSSGCPGKAGRREPLFTLASIPDTSHGQVYSETDLLTG